MQNYTAAAVEVAADVAEPTTRAAPREPERSYVPDAHHSPGKHVREHMKPQTTLRYVHAVGQGQNTRGGEASRFHFNLPCSDVLWGIIGLSPSNTLLPNGQNMFSSYVF
jgi:hypothetical protein